MPKLAHRQPFIIRPADDLTTAQPHLRHDSARLAQAFASRSDISEAYLQGIGAALWNALPRDTGERLEAARQAAGADILPIILESRSPAVQALPWEAIYHPQHGFLARNPAFTFSRAFSQRETLSTAARPAPLKALLFTSLPDDLDPETERLNVEREQERVQEAFLPFVAEGKALLEIPDDGRLETLKDLLKRFEPHVLYLSGHGKFVHPPGGEREPYGVFIFEDESGASLPIDEEKLAQTLVGSGVQIVVLSACESGKAASDDLNHGLVRRLAALGIPHVIGMRESVLDEAGIQFADALCKALANGERTDVALQDARGAMTAAAAGISRREAGLETAGKLMQSQWCLPMLVSPDPALPAADWANAALASKPRAVGKREETRFIGRRAELRRYKHRLLTGALRRLFISGAGGHGKTSLARKLARELQARGCVFFEWRADTPWRDFRQTLELALDVEPGRLFDRFAIRMKDQPEKVAEKFFELFVEQTGGKAALLFDNLESIQDDKTHALTDPEADLWLKAACRANLATLATSRWVLPDWEGESLPLESMNKGDFLSFARTLAERGKLNPLLLADRERRNRMYETLGRNPRGLEWFAAATLAMDPQEEAVFAEKLAQTRDELRQNMALEETLARLSQDAHMLLRRLPVYAAPVPAEGIVKLGLDLPDPAAALENLLAFSLLEITENTDYETLEYQVEPSLHSYLLEKNLLDASPLAKNAAADYLLWLMKQERNTYAHLALTIEALRHAERHNEADRLTLDTLVERYTLDGRYAELLERWLPHVIRSNDSTIKARALNSLGTTLISIGDYETALTYLKQSLDIRRQIGDKAGEGTTLNNISQIFKAQGDYETALTYLKQSLDIRRQIGDKAGEGTTLNNISQIYDAQGDYETALTYLKQSLDIRRQIGDKAGLCATLFNMGHIHAQNEQIQEALGAWLTVYKIAKEINEYQALQALSQLAPQLGLPEGLEGWEMLARRMTEDGGLETEAEDELGQLRDFVQGLVKAARERSPDAQKYFEAVSKMAVDSNAPPQYQELGSVLKKYMSGIRNPDLSKLPKEIAEIVQKALEGG